MHIRSLVPIQAILKEAASRWILPSGLTAGAEKTASVLRLPPLAPLAPLGEGADANNDGVPDVPMRADGRIPDSAIHEMWKKHKATPATDFQARNEIFKQLKGYVPTAIRPYEQSGAPIGEMRREVTTTMLRAIDDWNPEHESGAPLRNFVWRRVFPQGHKGMSVANRVVRKYADMKQIGGNRSQVITEARRIETEFKQETGRAPSDGEMGDMLGLPMDQITKLRMEMSPVYYSENLIDDDKDLGGTIDGRTKDAIRTVYASAIGPDQMLMQKLFWPLLGGTKPLSQKQNAWAQELGMTPSQVTRRKQSLERKVQRLM